jgi:hypothetical protein
MVRLARSLSRAETENKTADTCQLLEKIASDLQELQTRMQFENLFAAPSFRSQTREYFAPNRNADRQQRNPLFKKVQPKSVHRRRRLLSAPNIEEIQAIESRLLATSNEHSGT